MMSRWSRPRRVLVVEDEPNISQVCFRVLTREGLEVDIALNGSIAEEMLEKKDYDLCLIDMRTPVMNGRQLYQTILKRFPGLTQGVIFTTGDVSEEYTRRFLELSGRPFLPKPFSPDELREIVRKELKKLD